MDAIIVDGGHATRLTGYTPPKGLVPVGPNGETLLELLLDRLAVLGVESKPTLVLGYPSAKRFLRHPVAKRFEVVIDYDMAGPLPALAQVADRFESSDVVITTGDAWFSSLAQLGMTALHETETEGSVRVLTASAQEGRPQILSVGHRKPILYIGRFVKAGTVSYAGALRVVRCPAYWQALRTGLAAGMRWIVRPLLYLPAGAVKLLPVTGDWGHVNTAEDLMRVREMCNGRR